MRGLIYKICLNLHIDLVKWYYKEYILCISIYLVVCTTFIKNLAHVFCRLYLEIMFITLNGKSDVLQSLQR